VKIIRIFKKYLRSPRKLIRGLGTLGWFNWLPDKPYLKLVYWGETSKKLNLDAPVTYNEKLQWLKLYDRKPEYIKYADKYAVRSYIRETIGEQYLIPLLGVYESVEEIDWDSLPNQFVLKCTHGSGCNIICTDKDKLKIEVSKIKLNKWMKRNWYWFGREWPYKNIKPRIICETFISETDNTPDDYKVLCFNGKAKLIGVHIDRYGNHKFDNYDRQWEKTTIARMVQDGPIPNFVYEKPKQFEKMIQLSELLASNMSHVRIDWFIVRDKLYFGEITLYEASGFDHFDNKEDDYLLGSWIDLKEE
jgi:hypothetical protein